MTREELIARLGKTAGNVSSQVAALLTDAYRDEDGYWAYLPRGWHFINMECHTAHEWSAKDMRSVLKFSNIEYVGEDNDWD